MKHISKLIRSLAAAGLALVMTAGVALAADGTGIVTASSLRLRGEASTRSATLAIAPRNSKVTILENASDGWYKVSYNGSVGYMSADWLNVTSAPDPEPAGGDATTVSSAAKRGTVTDGPLNVRSGPATSYGRVGSLKKGASVTVLDSSTDGWYKVSSGSVTGYVSSKYISVSGTSATLSSGSSNASSNASSSGNSNAAATSGSEDKGIVTDGPLNVRSGPDTTYDKVGSLKKGASVTVLDSSTDGWYKISSGSVTGYVSAQYVAVGEAAIQAAAVKAVVTDGPLNVRSGPGTGYDKVGSLKRGSTVTLLDDGSSGWYKVTNGSVTGYVSASYIGVIGDGASEVGASAAALAVSLLGCRYVSGAEGPNSFDCSGLTYYIYKQLGYKISRGSSSQYRNNGYFVSSDDVQPGDLVFFFDSKFDYSGGTLPTTHVGICVGNGQFIHASTTSYRVQYDDLYGSYYTPYIVGFKRIA